MTRARAGAEWRFGALRHACKRRRPDPLSLITMRARWRFVRTALTPVSWHRRDCLCYGCYL